MLLAALVPTEVTTLQLHHLSKAMGTACPPHPLMACRTLPVLQASMADEPDLLDDEDVVMHDPEPPKMRRWFNEVMP